MFLIAKESPFYQLIAIRLGKSLTDRPDSRLVLCLPTREKKLGLDISLCVCILNLYLMPDKTAVTEIRPLQWHASELLYKSNSALQFVRATSLIFPGFLGNYF